MKVHDILSEAPLTPEEVKKILKGIEDAPNAEEGYKWFDGRDGEEIYLPTVGYQKGGKQFGISKYSDVKKYVDCFIPLNANNLHYGQISVQKNHLKRGVEKWSKEDPDNVPRNRFGDPELPRVIYSEKKFYVQDGHHRVTMMKLSGREYVKVSLLIYAGSDQNQVYVKPKVDKDDRFIPPK